MSLTDISGREWAHSETVKAGDKVETDGDFTCIAEGEVLTVRTDKAGKGIDSLYIPCKDGKHFLSGQIGDDGELVGLYSTSRQPTEAQ